MKRKYTLLTLILLTMFIRAKSQDIHFSQFYASPLMQNPAFTGFFDGDYRMTAIARSQWRSVTVPYTTVGGSIDLSFRSGLSKKDMYGVGAVILSDRAGDSRFTTTRVDITTAYSKVLDRFQHHYLSTGIDAAYTAAYIDYSRLTFDENFEGGITTENFGLNTTRYIDASAGIQYTYLANKNDNLTFGGAVYHINQPNQTFMNDRTSIVYRRYVLNASATYGIADRINLFPKFNYMVQGPNSEFNFGLFGRYDFSNSSKKVYGVYLGVLNRMNDAFIVVNRYDLNDVTVTFSYDFNYSTLSRVSRGLGGPELSIQYIGRFNKKTNKKVYCPVF
jgi:type IX secretion system PorP/SprF family membrane protein